MLAGSSLDLILFLLYVAGNVAFGFWVARRHGRSAREYFLAGEKLPWYAIGGSIIAANISTEHFIGMVGAAYAAGFVLAQWEWGNWFTFSALIWIFLPYYLRGGIYTMPEFLEGRYNRTCRYLFAVASLVLWIVSQLAVVMLAGAKAMEGMFGFSSDVTIPLMALLAGSYTIYGGLVAVAWTDFLQFVVLMIGGMYVAVTGLAKVGGLTSLMAAAPEKFKFIYPIDDPNYPWFGVYTLFLSIGIWYNCTNQFIVQRCLGARSEWDGRMGVVFAGYIKILLPLMIVIPGIVASRLFPGMTDPDMAYPRLIRELVPAGFGGLVMAAIGSSLLSHLSSVLNSTSTVFTMDLYKPLLRPAASSTELVRVGRWSGVVVMIFSTLLALWLRQGQSSVFSLIQDVGAWIAAPISVVFLAGVLWKRATAAAATFVLFFGFPYTWFIESVVFRHVEGLSRYNNYLNRTFVVWITCLVVMIAVSLLTRPEPEEKIRGMIWSPAQSRLPESERERNRGLRNLFFWWALFVGVMFALYAWVFTFQYLHRGA